MAKLVPLEDNVVVKRTEAEMTTKSGIILSDNKEKLNKGVVIAVGPGKILNDGNRGPMEVKEGDVIHFSYGANEIKIDGEELLIVSQNYILAKEE